MCYIIRRLRVGEGIPPETYFIEIERVMLSPDVEGEKKGGIKNAGLSQNVSETKWDKNLTGSNSRLGQNVYDK